MCKHCGDLVEVASWVPSKCGLIRPWKRRTLVRILLSTDFRESVARSTQPFNSGSSGAARPALRGCCILDPRGCHHSQWKVNWPGLRAGFGFWVLIRIDERSLQLSGLPCIPWVTHVTHAMSLALSRCPAEVLISKTHLLSFKTSSRLSAVWRALTIRSEVTYNCCVRLDRRWPVWPLFLV